MASKKNLVVTPMSDLLKTVNTNPRQKTPGEHDGEGGAFGQYSRTPSPNAVPEKIRDGKVPAAKGD